MQTKRKFFWSPDFRDIVIAALSNPHFSFESEARIKESLNAIKEFFVECVDERNQETPVSFL